MSVRPSRIIAGIAILFIVIIAGILLYVSFTDLSRFRPQIEVAVSGATGHEFKINGELKIELLPHFEVLIEDAVLANVAWGSEPNAVTIGHLAAKVGLWSLVFDPIKVENFTLSDVSVLWENNSEGVSNFLSKPVDSSEPKSEAKSVSSGNVQLPVLFHRAEISNITLTRREPGMVDRVSNLESLNIEPNDAGNLGLHGVGNVVDLPFAFDGEFGPNDRLQHLEEVSLNLTGNLGALRVETMLEIDGDKAVIDLNATYSGIDLKADGNVELTGGFTELRDIALTIGGLKATLNGKVSNVDGTVAFDITASAPSLTDIDSRLPPVPFTASASVSNSEDAIRVDDLALTLGDSDIAGQLRVDHNEGMQVAATITSKLLDLTPFMPAPKEEDSDEVADEEVTDTQASKYVFVEDPFNFEELQAANVSIDAKVDELRAATISIRNIVLNASVESGVVDLKASATGKDDGRIASEIQLNTTDSAADLSLLLQLNNLNLNLMSGDVPDDQIPSTDLTIEIKSSGDSPRAMAAAANGRVLLTQGPGTVDNGLIGKFSGDIISQLFGALNPLAEDEQYSRWDCSVFLFNITDGLSELDGFLMQGEKLQIVGGGEIDLTDEKIAIEFNTKPREGVGITADSIVTPFVEMSGTLANPGIGLNKKGVILTGGAAILTGGITLLAKGASDRASAEADACETALVAAGEHSPAQ